MQPIHGNNERQALDLHSNLPGAAAAGPACRYSDIARL